MSMESTNSDLHFLIERACGLVNKINDEISKETVSFCKLCSENGHLCGIAETPWEERERLIAIRDSLKDVENILDFVQRLQSCQKSQRHLELGKLEESRISLIEKVNAYKANGRRLDVIEELNAQFGKDLVDRDDDDDDDDDDLKEKRRRNSWSFVKSLFNPWLAIKLIVVSISISSSYNSYKAGQEYKSFQRQRLICPSNIAKGGKQDFLLVDPQTPLNVLHGRG